jgi:hypothetical protein
MSLPEAIQRVTLVYKNQHTHGAPREVVAKSMGYNSLNGASATSISALVKYGLLEGRGDEIRVSDRAMRIMHPQSHEEKSEALREAAASPELFREIAEKFPGRMPAEEVLKNYLIRDGFAPNAVPSVILAYRETNEFVEREAGAYDSGNSPPSEPVMQPNPQPAQHRSVPGVFAQPAVSPIIIDGNQRLLASYPFEGGGSLEIRVVGDISTEDALDMVETLVELKRKEITRNAAKAPKVSDPENSSA